MVHVLGRLRVRSVGEEATVSNELCIACLLLILGELLLILLGSSSRSSLSLSVRSLALSVRNRGGEQTRFP